MSIVIVFVLQILQYDNMNNAICHKNTNIYWASNI